MTRRKTVRNRTVVASAWPRPRQASIVFNRPMLRFDALDRVFTEDAYIDL
jgi:hypothetical protein